MKFKLDENLPLGLAEDLRRLGHKADTVEVEGLQGAIDPVVVEAAFQDKRILLTLDKGIANIHGYPASQSAGVVLFRPDTVGRTAVAAFIRERLDEVLASDLPGRLTVVGTTRIRFR